MPRRIISDNGTQFISGIMQQVTHCFGIQQCFTPVYHPEANPVERKNRDMKAQLGIYVGTDHTNWDDKLPTIRFAINTSRCGTTGYSAAYLTFGRELRTPDDTNRDLRAIIQAENFLPEITPILLTLADTMQMAQENQEGAQDQRKAYADKHRRPNPGYQKGDLVWANTHPVSRREQRFTSKLAPKRDGPYVIKRQVGSNSYKIQSRDPEPVSLGVYHASALTTYVGGPSEAPVPVATIRRRGRPRKVHSTEHTRKTEEVTPPRLEQMLNHSSRRLRVQRGRL
ncbi:uncharacterized protein LOC128896522 [Hylaeus anthracinus]|uniref:uncharacterized protein LOC128896522 n=1 Tax=Hylaeus anthracinus TaxID=313031 RepID=UPI0023BA3168|nr:uncharacterized protein LOC128896522 [Hylaeus anthracinus]